MFKCNYNMIIGCEFKMLNKFIKSLIIMLFGIILLYISYKLKEIISGEWLYKYSFAPYISDFIEYSPFYFIGILFNYNNFFNIIKNPKKWKLNTRSFYVILIGIFYSLTYKILFSYIPFYPLFLLDEKTIITWNIFVGYNLTRSIIKKNKEV